MTLCPPFLTPWAIYSRCPAACEHDGCGKDAGWGFAKPKQAPHTGSALSMGLKGKSSVNSQPRNPWASR